MRSIFYIFLALFLMLSNGIFAQQLSHKVEEYHTIEQANDEVILHCNSGIQLRLKQMNAGTFRIWFDTDSFQRNNPSFALTEEAKVRSEKIQLVEKENGCEMYTSELILRISKKPFGLKIYDKWQKLLLDDTEGAAFEHNSKEVRTSKRLRPNERIYGLGEKNGAINRVGKRFRMWNSDKPCYSPSEEPLYKSIPFFMSSAGYGIFFDNTHKTEFDFGALHPDTYSFSAPDGEMIYFFIHGPSFKQIIFRYTELTGKAIMPPAWAFGFAQCRGLLTNEKLSRQIAKSYREKQIPCDVIYQDIGWTQHLQDFEWRKGNYTNPVAMLRDLKAEGFKVVVSQDPVISKANQKQWKEADSLGYFATDTRTSKTYNMPWPWGGNCGVVDFTKPEVANWWGEYQQKPIDDGVAGFWTDMGEPAWSNEESTERLFMQHAAGKHAEIHNVYGLTWDKVVTEQWEKHNPNRRIFQMTRAAYAGMQRYTFGWSGDAGNGGNVNNGWKQLAAQIPLSMSAGLGLIPFWSCDISGYCGDIKDYDEFSELYIRWLQFGAFNPHSRIHHEGNNAVEPWLFGEEAERIAKSAIEQKYRLFPYLYSYARKAFDSGLPIIRTMVLEYPDDEACFDLNTQFMFGEELLVAPIVKKGAASKKIYLPEGQWIDFNNTNQLYEGQQWIEYPVELEYLPVLVKAGSVIPQMPTMQYIHEKANYPLLLEIFPASTNRNATFELYEDDGNTNNYKQDIYGTRKISCKTKRSAYELKFSSKANNNFQLQPRNWAFQLHLNKKPSSVKIGGRKMKQKKRKDDKQSLYSVWKQSQWYWDAKKKICFVWLPASMQQGLVQIERE